jgi:uncharacterized protein
MILNIAQIDEGRTELSQKVDIAPHRCGEYEIPSPLSCHATLEKLGTRIHVVVECNAEVRLTCCRCLEQYICPLCTCTRAFVFDHSAGRGKNEPVVSDSAYPDFYFDDTKREVDLSPALLDDIEVALPMKPLCSDACSGVTSKESLQCNDRNSGTQEATIDPRWEKLKKLRR